MSYIFSSNGNNYTFNKLDSMLITMPEKDGLHVLVRETKDGSPQYSWTDAKIIVKVNNAFILDYTPTENTSLSEVRIPFNLSSGHYLITTRLFCLNENLEETWMSCNTIEDVIKSDYYIKVYVNHNSESTCVLDTRIINTLNNVYTASDSCLLSNKGEEITVTVETNLKSCVFLKNYRSILLVFEQLV